MSQQTFPNPDPAIIGRFLASTAIGVVANLSLYLLLARRMGIPAAPANVIAALVVIVPRFWLQKLWVWKHRSRNRVGHEVLIHSAITIGGLALSTLVAGLLDRADAGAVQLAVGNVGSFAVAWAVRFVVSHVYLFTPEVS